MGEKVKQRAKKAFTYFKLISIRTLAAVLLGAVGIFIGYQIDYSNVDRAPASDYLRYTQFTVQNARVGEDVNFIACREYQRPYVVDSNLNVYVIESPGTGDERPVAVYGRTNSTTLTSNCENKTIREEDFHHTPGEYEIRACVEFEVRYDIKKNVCEKSNRYRIYDTPQNLQEQIDTLKKEQERLLGELNDAEGAPSPTQGVTGGATSNPSRSATSPTPTPSPQPQPTQPTTPTPVPENPPNVIVAPPRQCTVSVLGLNLVCL